MMFFDALATMNPFHQWGLYILLLALAFGGVRVLRSRLGSERGAVFGYPLAGLIILLFLWPMSEPHHRLYADFFKAYYPAAEMVWRDGPQAILPIIETRDFVNLPIVAWLFVPLTWLGEAAAGWIYLTLGAASTLGAWFLITRIGRLGRKASAFLLFLFLINGPLVYGFREGNSTHIILFLLLVSLRLLGNRKEFLTGLLLGFCAVIKLPLMLFGIYFLLRGKWRVAAGGAISLIAAGILSLSIFGTGINQTWYDQCVRPFKGHPMPAYNVQSIDGFLIRLKTCADGLHDWNPNKPTKLERQVRPIVFACLYGGLLAFGIMDHRRRKVVPPFSQALSKRDLLEFATVLNLALVTSPVSWSHYYLYLLLPWGLYLGRSLPLRYDSVTRWLFRASILLSSLPVVILPLGEGRLSGLAAKTLVSFCLFGGLLSLIAMGRGFLPHGKSSFHFGPQLRAFLKRAWRPAAFVLLIIAVGGPSWSWTSSHLILVSLVIVLVPALYLTGSERWRHWLDVAAVRFDAIPDRKLMLSVAGWVTLTSALVAIFVFESAPNVADSFSYLLQARIMASGALSIPVPGPGIDLAWTVQRDGQLFSVFTPGWPALLSAGVRIGTPQLVNPIFAGLTCVMTFLVLRELSGRRLARLVLLFCCFSPFLLFLSASMMAHTSLLFFVMLATWCFILKPGKLPRLAWDVLGGLAMAVAFTIRPQDAVPVWCALAVFLLWTERARAIPRLVVGGLALSLGLLANAAYFHGVAGVWNPTNSFLRQPGDEFGFGRNIGFPEWEDNFLTPGHNPWRSLLNFNFNMAVMNSDLLGWPLGAMAIAVFFLLWGRKNRGHQLGLLVFGFQALLNAGFWYHAVCMGARFYFDTMPYVLLFVASALVDAPEILSREFHLPTGVYTIAFIRTVAVLSTGWCLFAYLPTVILVTPYSSFCYEDNSIRDHVRRKRLDNALVFVDPPGEMAWPALMLNSYPIEESRVICLPDMGDEENARTVARFPDRDVHYYKAHFAISHYKRELRRLSLWDLAGHAQVSADPVSKQYQQDIP